MLVMLDFVLHAAYEESSVEWHFFLKNHYRSHSKEEGVVKVQLEINDLGPRWSLYL